MPNDEETDQFVLDEIIREVEGSDGDAISLVDVSAVNHHAKDEVKKFDGKTKFSASIALMRKSTVWEYCERYGGVSILFVV